MNARSAEPLGITGMARSADDSVGPRPAPGGSTVHEYPDWRTEELAHKYNEEPEPRSDPYIDRGINRRDF